MNTGINAPMILSYLISSKMYLSYITMKYPSNIVATTIFFEKNK